MRFPIIKSCLFVLIALFALQAQAALPLTSEVFAGSIPDNVTDTVAIDLNQDGRLDFLTSHLSSAGVGQIYWHRRNGDGSYTQFTVASAATSYLDIDVVDLDGDGDLDVVSGASADPTLNWHENNGSESFATTGLASIGVPTVAISVGDIDTDGDIDIVGGASLGGSLTLYTNNGSQSFIQSSVYNGSSTLFEEIEIVDLDADGDQDIVVASDDRAGSSEQFGLHFYEWTGSSFLRQQVGGADFIATELEVADFDSDGDLDIVFANAAYGIARNNGSEVFSVLQLEAEFTLNSTVSELVATDVDFDGDVDLLMQYSINSSSPNNSRIHLRQNNGDGFVTVAPGESRTVLDQSGATGAGLAVGDVDNDGDLDMLSAAIETGVNALVTDVSIHRQGEFGAGETIASGLSLPASMQAADFDGDGDLDLVSASQVSDLVAWHRNNGDGTYSQIGVATGQDGVRDLQIADLDQDGDPDIIAALANADELRWYRNNSGAASWTAFDIATGATSLDRPSAVAPIDMDGDGDLDVVAAAEFGDEIVWYDNNGSQAFTKRTIFTGADGASDVIAVDFDSDGDIDVISASYNDDLVRLYRNNGSQVFTSTSFPGTFDQPNHVDVGDWDNDGDLDVLVASDATNSLLVVRQIGTTLFSTITPVSNAQGPFEAFLADMDSDGMLDIVVTEIDADVINVYSRQSTGLITSQTVASTTGNRLTVVDLDQNGALDVISIGAAGSRFDWYPQTQAQFALETIDAAPATAEPGSQFAQLSFDMTHLGQPDDVEARLLNVHLRLEDSEGNPINSVSAANALLEEVSLWVDAGSPGFDPAEDVFVEDYPTLIPTSDGEIFLGFNGGTIGLLETYLDPGETKTFLVVLQFTDDADTLADPTVRTVHVTESSTEAVHLGAYAGPTPLDLRPVDNVTSTATRAELPDADGDGVPDLQDNCPAISNADQKDFDGDRIGDACDPDDDDDGMSDVFENANGFDPFDKTDADEDADRDGLTNLEEANGGTDPRDSDSDGDGLDDGLDDSPTKSSNACFRRTELANVTVRNRGLVQCQADVDITVRDTTVLEPGAAAEIFAPQVSFDPGFSVPTSATVRVTITETLPE